MNTKVAPELIIPHVARNNALLIQNMPYILKNINPPSVHIITKGENIDFLKANLPLPKVYFHNEDEILKGLPYKGIENRIRNTSIPQSKTGWYLQQFIKLGWAKRQDAPEWYASWDSDTFPLRPIRFFEESAEGIKPVFNIKQENNPAYFQTMQEIWGINKTVDFSFIAETMVFNSAIVREMLDKIGEPFYKRIIEVAANTVRPDAAFSEFETYGTYTTINYPALYSTRKIKAHRMGARTYGLNPTEADLYRASLHYETISFESWSRHIPFYINTQKFISNIIYALHKASHKFLHNAQHKNQTV